jgi:hypothetical protein
MDRRPWQPRQLAGENGSSAPLGASFDAGELAGELFEADTDTLMPDVAVDDAADADRAAADIAFKPNCLGIQTSINEHPADAGCPPLIQA